MQLLSFLIKDFLIPGSEMFLLVGMAAGVTASFGRGTFPLWGRRWLVGLCLLYVVLAMPWTSDALFAGLSHNYQRLASAAEAHGASTVVVLGNGVQPRRASGRSLDVLNLPSAYGVLEAARLYQGLGAPTILASGGPYPGGIGRSESEAMRDALIQLGVPSDHIELEAASQDTREQAINVAAWLHAHHVDEFVLVTSPEHMLRAASALEKVGARPIPSITQLRYGGGITPFWPTQYALQGSEAAIYEYIAVAYYWARGWA